MIKPHVCYLRQMLPNGLLEWSRDVSSYYKIDSLSSDAILVLKCLLLHSGDIQVNPGPPKHPCGLCNKVVRCNQKAILNARNAFIVFISTVLQCTTILAVILVLSGYVTFVPFQPFPQLFFSTIWTALRVITATRAFNLTTLQQDYRLTKVSLLPWNHCRTPPAWLLVLPNRRGGSWRSFRWIVIA